MAIIGKHVVLRGERRESDDEDLFRWFKLEEWLYYDSPSSPFKSISREEFEARCRRRPKTPAPGTHTWQIDTVEGKHIGSVRYYQLNEQAGYAYLGVSLPEESTWGKGNGTEALCLLIDHLFATTVLRELRTATWTGNRRMMRCAEKCGFQEIARTPHDVEFSTRGEPLEQIEFCITRSAWLARRESRA